MVFACGAVLPTRMEEPMDLPNFHATPMLIAPRPVWVCRAAAHPSDSRHAQSSTLGATVRPSPPPSHVRQNSCRNGCPLVSWVCVRAVLLAKMDKPADLLHILQAMLVDNFPIPRRAGKPVPGALNGGSIVSAWLDNHLESMSAFRGQRKMQEVIAQETSREIRVSRGCAQCLPHDPGWEGGLRRRVRRGAVPRMTRVQKAGERGCAQCLSYDIVCFMKCPAPTKPTLAWWGGPLVSRGLLVFDGRRRQLLGCSSA